MTAPVAGFVQLPSDSGNTGKKMRTVRRTVGGDTVDAHYFVPVLSQSTTSVYRLALVQNTVLAAAQNGTTAVMLIGHMPSTATTRAMRLRRLSFSAQHSTALATPTAPRLLARRFTSSGSLTGALLAPNINDSAVHDTPACLFSLATTGLTVVHVGIGFGVGALPAAITAVGASDPCFLDMVDPASDEDEWPVFRPGQGFVVFQDTAGTASDTRKFNLQCLCDEIDIS